MKKFVFTLQPVLELRKRVEDEKQLVVAKRRRELDDAEAELKRLRDEFHSGSERLRREHAVLTTDELQSIYAHLQFVDRCTVSQQKIVAERKAALDRALADLLSAAKQKKVVEKLKEQRKELHALEEQRIEQNELDDGNARRFGRALIGGSP